MSKQQEPIVKMWTPYHIKVDENYRYFPKNLLFFVGNQILRVLVFTILPIWNQFFFGLKVEGKEILKKHEGKAITICNHVHMLDCTMIGCIDPKKSIYYPTLKSNLEIPFIRFLVKLLGGMPIPQTTKALDHFRQAVKQVFQQGKLIHMYPEAMLYPYYDGIRPFKKGAFSFSYDYNTPIIPMVITYRPATGIRKYLKQKPFLTLTILNPIYPNQENERTQEIEYLKETCYQTMNQYYKTHSQTSLSN